jgi:hypothetical protein
VDKGEDAQDIGASFDLAIDGSSDLSVGEAGLSVGVLIKE